MDTISELSMDYKKARRIYNRINQIIAVAICFIEIGMYALMRFQGLLHPQSALPYFILYVLLPSSINILANVVAGILIRKNPDNEKIQNATPVMVMTVMCMVVASIHSCFKDTMVVFCIPIFMTAVFEDQLLRLYTVLFSNIGIIFGVIGRVCLNDVEQDTYIVEEVCVAIIIIEVANVLAKFVIQVLGDKRKKLEKLTRIKHEAMREAQAANNAKSEFLANMSHEIRTPLNAVIGMTEMIVRRTKETESRACAVDIQNAGETLLSIINDILDISKIESGRMEIVNSDYELGSLIHDCYNIVELKARQKGLAFSVGCDPMIPRMYRGDEYHIRQVVINLLTNAVKYTEEGLVSMNVSCKMSEGKTLLNISVKDSGIGIRSENIENIFNKFDRFDTTRNRRVEGTGLGLAITRQLVELMGGTISVDSVYGVGSVFSVVIPQEVVDDTPIGNVHTSYLANADVKEEYRQYFEAPDARLLVVDDIQVNQKVFEKLLQDTRVKIDMASNGIECLNKISDYKYDIIFMDHMMPGMDGVETLKQMNTRADSKNKSTPVIMLTANALEGAKEEYINYGFKDYLAKPVKGDKLEKIIYKYLPPEKIIKVNPNSNPSDTSASLEIIRESIPELDIEEGVEYCLGDKKFYIEMLHEFANSEIYEKAMTAYDISDWKDYQIEIHGMKSSAKMLGLRELSKDCLMLEQAVLREDYEYLHIRHKNVFEKIGSIRQKIKECGV